MTSDRTVWSVRMRASGNIGHISGAERLVLDDQLKDTVSALFDRGISSGADSAFLQITVDKIDPAYIQRSQALPVSTVICQSHQESKSAARLILEEAGIAISVFNEAWSLISRPDTERPMRGAAFFESQSGSRLDLDTERGVRATRMDYAPEDMASIADAFAEAQLAHFRTQEALLVATKVSWSGVIGELCWSDDPHYSAGYIATRKRGYVRIPDFKPPGALGGRAFFVDPNSDLTSVIHRLENAPLWVYGPLVVHPTVRASDLFTVAAAP